MFDKEPTDPLSLPPLCDRKPADGVLRRMYRDEHPAAQPRAGTATSLAHAVRTPPLDIPLQSAMKSWVVHQRAKELLHFRTEEQPVCGIFGICALDTHPLPPCRRRKIACERSFVLTDGSLSGWILPVLSVRITECENHEGYYAPACRIVQHKLVHPSEAAHSMSSISLLTADHRAFFEASESRNSNV